MINEVSLSADGVGWSTYLLLLLLLVPYLLFLDSAGLICLFWAGSR